MEAAIPELRSDLEFGFIDKSTPAAKLFDPHLIHNQPQKTMISALRDELSKSDSFRFSIAFISSSGLAMLKQALLEFRGTGTIITSRYLDFNHPDVFRELLTLDRIDVRIYDHPTSGFHSKGYIFERGPILTAIVGSSNLTDAALASNQEWNIKFSTHSDGDIAYQAEEAVNRQLQHSTPLTTEWIENYEKSRRPNVNPALFSFAGEPLQPGINVVANEMQSQALESLETLRESGENKAVIVSATGTGKTILAALAARNFNPKRMLFVVHREQILDKAISEFETVLKEPRSAFGKLSGGLKEIDRKYVFATIQSLSRTDTLSALPRDYFDFIIIDEVHRSGSGSYRRIVDHFSPQFLLGLTATPERTDGFNVFQLFDFNVPYEIRLQTALEERMLVPFHYFGVTDYVTSDNQTVTETSQLSKLVASERIHHLIQKLELYGHANNVRGLMFCSRTEEVRELSKLLNSASVNGRLLRTAYLTGEDSIERREAIVRQLELGELDYILTVDIFNEGIDIPCINQIVMLRSTKSSIIFTQQLGRGLRKFQGKDHLRVIDFIGNYANNYLIPIALFGDQSRDKDRTRKLIMRSQTAGTISGVSTVNFDPIARARILDSLAEARIVGKQEFKKDIELLKNRLNKIPKLFDFARFNTVDPVVIASKFGNYWSLLNGLKFVDTPPTEQQAKFLNFLSAELLNGKRPHELLILKSLLEGRTLTFDDTKSLISAAHSNDSDSIVESAIRVLGFGFHTETEVKKYGGIAPAFKRGNVYHLSPEFENNYHNSEMFKLHVDDIIDTGLFLARERHSWNGELVVGGRYSRKDVCRILNWNSNNYSTIYGYKWDKKTDTCPVFVTYHKDEEVDASISYEDEFTSPRVLHWYTRSRRTLESSEVKAIVSNSVDIHVFVKKDDAEGTDFFYLGPAISSNAKQEQMPGNNGSTLDVVSMDLNLEYEVEQSLFDYLQAT